jgi:RND superfamily putative drug exporter
MKTRLSPAAIGRWSARRPWLAIACWLAFVVACVGTLAATGSKQLQSGATGESARAERMMGEHQIRPPAAAFEEYAYVHSATLTATDPAFRAVAAKVAKTMKDTVVGATPASSAPPPAGANQKGMVRPPARITTTISADGHAALIASAPDQSFSTDALGAAVAADGTGQVSAVLDDNTADTGNSDLRRTEILSLPVTLLVLLIAFGALVAAVVPVLLGATAVVAAFGLLGPISHAFALDSSVKTVVLLIGMAVGVDYALFYVIRSREERDRGLASHEALEKTARTSGHTVLVAGTTVGVAMAAQFVIGSTIFNGIASGTIAVIACAVAGSVTVLPAVLELLGPRIDRGRIPFLPHLAVGNESRFWPAVIDRVLRRPVLSVAATVALLVALAIPALQLHLAFPSSDVNAGRISPSLQQQIQHDFPNTSTVALVVFSWPSGQRAQAERAAKQLTTLATSSGVAHPPYAIGASGDRMAGMITLPLSGLGDDATSKAALKKLRDTLIPETLGRVPGVQTDVTGDAARDVDFTSQMTSALPYVIAVVLVFAFLILLVTFRSLVIPIKAIVLNLLSVAASYGVLVLVFQRHWAEGLLGFHSIGSVISWLPVFLFVVLFGLSMDYHIFILRRVREAIDDGMSNDDALRYGITRTAGVVTSAALVMFGVFSLFGTARGLDLKQAGVGLAVAVLLDATIVRAVLLPASMKLLGDWNWYLPRWLEWLPQADQYRRPREVTNPEPVALHL